MMYCIMVVVEVFLLGNVFIVGSGKSKLDGVDRFFFIVVIWFGDIINRYGIISMSCFQCVYCYFYYDGFIYCVMLCQCFFVYVDYLCFGFVIVGDKFVFKSGGVIGNIGNYFCYLIIGIRFGSCYGCVMGFQCLFNLFI